MKTHCRLAVLSFLLLTSLALHQETFASNIAITPTAPAINPGQTLQFYATNSSGISGPLQQTRSLATGFYHACALLLDGTVKCWGDNYYGQLGNGTFATSGTPVMVSGLRNVIALAAGAYHTCAVLSTGQAKCWGYNGYGELGNGTTTSSNIPVTVSFPSGQAIGITAGTVHSCAVMSGGSVQCWGSNSHGQLGNGNSSIPFSATPATIPGLSFVGSIAAGAYHTCVLEVTATVYCWGYNALGQLGDGTKTTSYVPVQSQIDEDQNEAEHVAPKALVTGGNHTCALIDFNGQVMCWGDLINAAIPTSIPAVSGAKSLTAGYWEACVVLATGTAQCWGQNYHGELGGANPPTTTTPVNITTPTAISAMSGGGMYTCALIADGTTSCWGSGTLGELGNGKTSDSPTPVTVTGGDFLPNAGVRKVVNGGEHSCALLGDGTVACWGPNLQGQEGGGPSVNYAPTPSVVPNLSHVIDIAAGLSNSCALIADGSVQCWGYNFEYPNSQCTYGQNYQCYYEPVTEGSVSRAIAITSGGNHACALIVDGSVLCWGQNPYGEVCPNCGSGNSQVYPPTTVAGIFPAASITAGIDHTCALHAIGHVTCWGNNNQGQLGGSTAQGPVFLPNIQFVSSMSSGAEFSCAVIFTGAVQCWGTDYRGQLGDGQVSTYSVNPVTPNVSGAVSVAAGYSSACAVLAGGETECWGDNYYGELGNGSTSPYQNSAPLTPFAVPNLSGAVSSSVGQESASALLVNGTVQTWGNNSWGQLGNGSFNNPQPYAAGTSHIGDALTWTSSNLAVATIDPVTGLAIAAGNASAGSSTTILVTQGNQSASATLTVN